MELSMGNSSAGERYGPGIAWSRRWMDMILRSDPGILVRLLGRKLSGVWSSKLQFKSSVTLI